MEKYKLINITTKEEHFCDKITIDGFDYYMSNEKANKINQWVLDTDNFPDCIVYKTDEEFFRIGKEEFLCTATNNPNIDIAKVVDEVEALAWHSTNKKYPDVNDENSSQEELNIWNSYWEGFQTGHNKSKETHPNSDEDTIGFAVWRSTTNTKEFHNCKNVQEQFQLWKEQQPKIVYYK